MAPSILFLLVLLLFSAAALPLSVYSSGESFSIDLIHRDSPNSPFYNPTLSRSDRLRAAAHRSVARANRFRASSTTAAATNIVSPLIPDSAEYLMTINIGTPPFKTMLIADTGSDLVWTQCKPCTDCYYQTDPMFDPTTSSTYSTDTCSATGRSLCQNHCSAADPCVYSNYPYGDGSKTSGVLSTETFTFSSSVSVPKIVFGCSDESTGSFDKTEDGIAGLGGGPLSLVSQLASSTDNKFSYCLVPHSAANSYSLLSFGDGAEVNGPDAVTTPLVAGNSATYYTVSLEEISVGDVKAGTGQGDIIIDSGTFLTILDNSMMEPLVDKVVQAVKYPRVKYSNLLDPCFDVSGASGGSPEFPELTFEFSKAPVTLPPMNAFVEVDEGIICLTIVSSGNGGIRIFGNIAQQNLHIGYDLGARTVTFAPADCANL